MPGQGKFDGLQVPGITDALFAVPVQRPSTDGEIKKPRPQRAVERGACGYCSAANVGLLAVAGERRDGHLVWRAHNYKTHGGTSVPCRASGVRLCAAPARAYGGITVPTCPCGATRAVETH
jgi:hypothetical protein